MQYRSRCKVYQLNRCVYYSSFSFVVRAIAVLTNLDEKKNSRNRMDATIAERVSHTSDSGGGAFFNYCIGCGLLVATQIIQQWLLEFSIPDCPTLVGYSTIRTTPHPVPVEIGCMPRLPKESHFRLFPLSFLSASFLQHQLLHSFFVI